MMKYDVLVSWEEYLRWSLETGFSKLALTDSGSLVNQKYTINSQILKFFLCLKANYGQMRNKFEKVVSKDHSNAS